MDLNNIKLTPSDAIALYRTSLVESDEKIIAPAVLETLPENTSSKKYLGGNKKNILIAVNHAGTTYLPDDELNFLTSILSACQLSLDDVAIINTNNNPAYTYKDYLGEFKSSTVLLFGIDPVSFGLPLDFPQFQIQSFTKCTFLHSPALHEYDKLLKSKLWVCLKRIFNIP